MAVESDLARIADALERIAAVADWYRARQATEPPPRPEPAPVDSPTIARFRTALAKVVRDEQAIKLWLKARDSISDAEKPVAWAALVGHLRTISKRVDLEQWLRAQIAQPPVAPTVRPAPARTPGGRR